MWNIKQIIKKRAGILLDKFLKIPAFQIFVNDRYNTKEHSVINDKFLVNAFYPYEGFEFGINDQSDSIFEVEQHYKFDDILPTDIVLDIGANVGSFSMFASRTAKKVYAVEPIYPHLVKENISKNNIKNIDVFDIGLGKGSKNIRYGKINKTVYCRPLSEIIALCGGHIDFLKIDCEGGEWSIKPEELKGIRRIEGEIHNLDGFHDVNNFVSMIEKIGFECKVHRFCDVIILIHAERR